VKGVGDYGNCVGVPNLGGEVVFDPAYEHNPLVNAMCVGVLRTEDLIRAKASGVGNPIIAVGARTGRDGIHGASFASEDLSEESDAKRPRVQVGDPFTEKLLLEASLELITSGHIVAIQDMGAAGLTSSSAEMAARGEVGVTIDVTKVPVRETKMTPYEILLSESQERMLVVAKRGHEDDVRAILERWDLNAAVIGEVIAEPVYRVTEGDHVVAEFPGSRLVSDCPVYQPEARESAAVAERRGKNADATPERAEEADPAWTLEQLLRSPTIASKTWVYRQYDSTVRTNTVRAPGGDAGVLRIRGTKKGIAVKTDGNGRYVYLDPRVGGRIAVAEAARNVACTGARPMAITNCLNFGNPRKPETYYQLREAVLGIGEACRALGTPVTGGNVSLYNESPAGAVYPTPVIGMIGVLEDASRSVPSHFQHAGDAIVLIGEPAKSIGGTEYLRVIHGDVAGAPPPCDLLRERALIDTLVDIANGGLARSAHDVSDGGLAVALAECAIGNDERHFGLDVDLSPWNAQGARAVLFGEAQACAVVSTHAADEVIAIATRHGIAARRIGAVGHADDGITIRMGGRDLRGAAVRFARAYHDAIPGRMRVPAAAGVPA